MKQPRPHDARIQQMILDRIELSGDCWAWTGYVNRSGYGQLSVGSNGTWSSYMAHRAAYATFVGPIPDGLVLDHLCRVRHCVNPDHLDPVTHRVNLERSMRSIYIVRRTGKCTRGHETREVNGSYKCRACQNERHNIRQRERDLLNPEARARRNARRSEQRRLRQAQAKEARRDE